MHDEQLWAKQRQEAAEGGAGRHRAARMDRFIAQHGSGKLKSRLRKKQQRRQRRAAERKARR